MVFKVDYCGKLVEFTLKWIKFSKSAVNYGASKFWSIFRNSSKNIVEIAFLFRGTVTQKRTGCFEKGGYRANKLLFWIFPLGGVGDTEKNLSYSSFFSGTPSFCALFKVYLDYLPKTSCYSPLRLSDELIWLQSSPKRAVNLSRVELAKFSILSINDACVKSHVAFAGWTQVSC